ncbi:MAG: HU family DNA-binding protein [Candidatus Margulisbacteria bacterium]|nr:HU family DNA-binding protein [Candidatus Margulisiibacteriota bacterium]MBU1021398.1 HU family DNA-binding protein [Candidatus Margulisiibacteriota bacterium]MBU1729113.1 HU family DNA-binding protein [Candidatus Margulisiibacteriota bacterium]MBU1954786.1 HU family DNA-binding protein [Candidatus Margulisiibacteriota bacterium]
MNKKQLISKVGREVKVRKAVVEKVLDKALDLITAELTGGGKVRLVGFGNFIIRTRASRVGRNPRTGEKIEIPSSKSPAFVPGINLKKAIKE